LPDASTGPLAVILAAGVGRRLGTDAGPHKILLTFGGRTLLERHLRALREVGVGEVWITVGHAGDAIRQEVARLGRFAVRFVENPRYRDGSLLSLQAQGPRLRAGRPVLLMDGDVLYDPRMLRRLLDAPAENALLIDRELEPGDEPVKVCFNAGGAICDFRKVPEHAGVRHGESVGFFRFSAAGAAALADRCDARAAKGPASLEYEEAIRDLILADPQRFDAVDVTDLAWTEIDFEADVAKARDDVLPKLAV
jgi:choline kinase